MTDNELIAGLAGLIIIGLVILVLVEVLPRKKPVKVITRREYIPYPYRVKTHIRHHVKGHRNTPFCEHTAKGCYPGTQTPIP